MEATPHKLSERHDQGFTLVEIVVTAVLLMVMVGSVGTLMITGWNASEYAKNLNRVTEISQEILDDLRLELVTATKLLHDDPEGQDFLALLDLTASPPPIDTSRLPTLDQSGIIRADVAGAEISGNSLFFARKSWTDRFETSSGEVYLTDVYRVTYLYLTSVDGGPAAGSPSGLNLVQWASEPLADGRQLDGILSAADRAEVVQHLALGTAGTDGIAHPLVSVAWLTGQLSTVVGTLRQLDPGSGAMQAVPFGGRTAPWSILPSLGLARGEFSRLAVRHHSVATNFARPNLGVPRFGIVDPANDGFPHGLEIQIVGPSSSRRVLIHLVLVNTTLRQQTAWSDLQIVVGSRDT